MSFDLCSSSFDNTGAVKCDRRRGIPKKVIIGGKVFATGDYTSQSVFDAALLAAFKVAKGAAGKLYPFPEITGVTDTTEANTESTLGAFGPKVTLVEGKPGYVFDVIAGTDQEKRLRKFNGQQVPVFILDDSNTVWGKKDSSGNFSGTDVLIHTTPHKFGDAQAGQTTKVAISFVSTSDLYDSAAFIDTDLSASDMVGQIDFTLSEAVASVANVHTIKAVAATAGINSSVNLYDYFDDEIAAAGAWVAGTGTDYGTSLTITTVAKDATNKAWDITFDSTEYTALGSGAKIKINLAAPSALDALGVTETEGIAVIATKSA